MKSDFMGGRTAAILLLVGAFASLALLLLLAYAPDLRNADNTGNNGLSRSAIGFAGLRELLQLSGIPAEIDRSRLGHTTRPGLIIVTPDATTSPVDLRDFVSSADAPVLIVLPKWETVPLPLQNGWVMKAGVIPPLIVTRLIARVLPLGITRRPGDTKEITLSSPYSIITIPEPLSSIEQLQTVGGRGDELLIVQGRGNAAVLLSRRQGTREFHILSDPDLMNNHGLSDRATAHAALAIIGALRIGKGPVLLDVTLNGLGSSPSLLRSMFEQPFRGASICALLAAILMALHALVRFGAPEGRPEIERSKKALADNTAGLVRMTGREGGMARRYVAATRDMALARLGARRVTLQAQDALLAALERNNGLDGTYAQLSAEAAEARKSDDLIRIAGKVYAWRVRITGEH
jgi:hypothetical protein